MLARLGVGIADIEGLIFKALDVEYFTGLQVHHACSVSVHYHNKWIAVHVEVGVRLHRIANIQFVDALGVEFWGVH